MKVRNGFISNSSSSSFIIIGAKMPIVHEIFTEEFIQEMYEQDELEFYEMNAFYCFGETLIDINEYGEVDEKEIDIPNSSDILEKIQKYFPDITNEDIKIFCGIHTC